MSESETKNLLFTPVEMGNIDALAAESGINGYGLMIKAGYAVAAALLRNFPSVKRGVVLCGPGNNGGDGYVAANALKNAGVTVSLFHVGNPDKLQGYAKKARKDCLINSSPLNAYTIMPGDVIVDALFGAGLMRPLSKTICDVIDAVNLQHVPVIAVDLPSGVSGLSGKILGNAFQASHTVTFMAPKPGHYLLPGRSYCGVLEVFNIGIPSRILTEAHGDFFLNSPSLWQTKVPETFVSSHKYQRGHLGVFSGGAMATGAARLAAFAGLRAGAGLVTLAIPPDAELETAAQITAIMLKIISTPQEVSEWLEDKRLSAFVLGPGFGIGAKTRDFVLALRERSIVLDADAITSFSECPQTLFNMFRSCEPHLVLTPHQGEFERLFPDIAGDEKGSKLEKAQSAAKRANAIILYKGSDTVIAAPDGRAVINANAPPWLATAGSGDVLAGIVGGLLAQGVPAFEATCAGAWLHGEAGTLAGEGLTAEDLSENFPRLSDIG